MALSWQKPTHIPSISYQSNETGTWRCGSSITSVIDKTIDSAPFLEDVVSQSLRKCLVQDIARKALSLSTQIAYFVDHLLSFTAVQVVDSDYGALLAQEEGSCTADSWVGKHRQPAM